MIWKTPVTLKFLNSLATDTLVEHIGIEYTEIGDDYLIARMPVDKRTHQPYGILHGGASVVLAETLGSVAGNLVLEDPIKNGVVGLEINANHLKPVRSGWVYGKATAVRIGRTTQVWDIVLRDEAGNKTCVSRLTVMVIEREKVK